MIDTTTRRHLFDLSVLAISAVVFGAAALEIARVDGQRTQVIEPPRAAMAVSEVRGPPAPGLTPAPTAKRRVVVVRRSRAS